MKSIWYVIINPTSGKGKSLKEIDNLKELFLQYDIPVKLVISKFAKHEKT